jgi:pimeloyl-ACP methyl ester carboxylesterase
MSEFDLTLPEGRTLHVYASDDEPSDRLTVFWHHGTPNIGAPPEPLLPTAERLGMRWVSYDRPGYGGSSFDPGRNIASAAADVSAIADALDVGRFAVMGHSGGAVHALACGALLPARVVGVVAAAAMAPFDAEELDWFAGMCASCAATLRAATNGRAAKEAFEKSATYDPEMFTPSDHAALAGEWSWLLDVVRPALEGGPGGLIDDDLAAVAPWGFDPAQATVPIVLLHGDQDRIAPSTHGRWLAERCPSAELWLTDLDGHISILNSSTKALEWLAAQSRT